MRTGGWVRLLGLCVLAGLSGSCGGGDGEGGGGDGGIRPFEPPDLGLREVTRVVRVELPAPRQATPEFTVENSRAAVPLGVGGQAELPAYDGGPQLTALVTPAGNAMLLGWIDAERQTLSTQTTAEVLLYQQLGGWLLLTEMLPNVLELIRDTANLDAVEQALAAAVAADPDALADGEPAVTAALEAVVADLRGQAGGRTVIIEPGEEKSGLGVVQGDGLNTVRIRNSYRRRAHAWLMRVEYLPASGGAAVPAFADIENFSIPAVTGAQELMSTLVDLLTGNWAWQPVVLPERTLERYPADARATVYELMTVGAGAREGEMDRITDAQRDKRTQLVRYQFIVDFIVPMVANIMLPAASESIDDYLGWINGSAVVEDLINVFGREVPNLWTKVDAGQTGQAVVDAVRAIVSSETLRLIVLQRIWDGIFARDGIAQANRFGGIASRAMVILTGVDLGLTAIDSIIQVDHWAQSNGADSWQLTVSPSTVRLTPGESWLPSNREVRLSCGVVGSRQSSTLEYAFRCDGTAGMIHNDRHSAAISFTSSLPWVMYRPNGDVGRDDTVTVTVSERTSAGTTPVGQAQAVIHVSHLWLDPSPLTVAENERPTINLSVMNDPGPYQIVWNCSGGRISADGIGWATRVTGNATTVHYGRGTGFPAEVAVTCQVKHVDGDTERELGTVACPITLEEYRFPATLRGIVTRIPGVTVGAKYGVQFAKQPDATGYSIRGSGFHDPLAYGDSYRGSLPPVNPGDEDLGDAWFVQMTAGGGSWNPDVTDDELIASHSWRFAGGEFWVWPHYF